MHATRTSRDAAKRSPGSHGFTITELLIVIAIIAVLGAVILVAMRGVRSSALRTDSVNALRQMVGGYNSYLADNRQRLMPGFVDPNAAEDLRLTARLAEGQSLPDDPDTTDSYGDVGSYVWRLAPYLDHNWRTFFVGFRDAGTIGTLENDYQGERYGPGTGAANPDGGIAMMPAFGLNSIFLGGDTTHGGDAARSYNPISGTGEMDNGDMWAATRLTHVRNPSQVIVFGSVARANPNQSDDRLYLTSERMPHEMGYPELRPPFTDRTTGGQWINWQWCYQCVRDENNRPIPGINRNPDEGEYSFGGFGAGLPITRWGGTHYPAAQLDGSAGTYDIRQVSMDMRRWSPFAVGTDIPAIDLPGYTE